MAESAVLRRSFSNPSESCFQEGDPLRALGESISFGRYMSESLAWEKWSTFSHNRYLEEAEKYSKPGSVAKMKAYFEAHYKRIGAKKQAAQEQASDAASSFEQDVQDNVNDTSSLNLGAAEANAYPSAHESPVTETPDTEVPPNVVVSSCGSSAETKGLQNVETNDVETRAMVTDSTGSHVQAEVYQVKNLQMNINVSESASENEMKANESSDAMESNFVVATLERKVPVQKEFEKENMDSKSKKKSAISSIKKPTKSNVSKLSSSLARLATPICPKKESCGTPKSRKSGTKELVEEKRPAPKLIRMSVNSDANLIKKDSQASQKTRMGKVFTPLSKIIRDSFASSPAPSRASVSSAVRPTSSTTHTETRSRSRVALEKAFSKSRKLEQKFQCPPVVVKKSSVQSPSPTIFSSFNFRTAERAAKRREFFQKRMETEVEKMQLLDKAKQVKAKPDFRKSCVNMKVNPSEDIKTEVSGDNMDKIPLRQTVSPKRRSRPASDLAGSTCFRPPQWIIGSKPGREKAKPIPVQSGTPLAKKKRHENASPNIL